MTGTIHKQLSSHLVLVDEERVKDWEILDFGMGTGVKSQVTV